MATASGISKQVIIKKETTWGVAAGTGSGLYLRRVTSDLSLGKDVYESGEIVSHAQVGDMRHGVRRVTGTLNGELSPGAYNLFMQSALRKDFVAGVNSTVLTNVTAAAGPPGTFTRAAGSFLTDGFKIGDIIRWTGWTTTGTANNTRNYRITALSATVMTTSGLLDEVVAAKASGDSVTATVTGKKTHIPVTALTTDSYTIEHNFPDIVQSEQFLGCRVGSMNLALPATGMATVGFGLVGKDIVTSTGAYFVTPTAVSTGGIFAAVNGLLRIGGVDVAVVTGLDLSLDLGLTSEPVVGANTVAAITHARSRVSGSFTAFFEDAVLRDIFINETESSLIVMLKATSAIDSPFLGITMSRIKFAGASKDDGEKGIVGTYPFTALLNTAGGSGIANENTTISIQDSSI